MIRALVALLLVHLISAQPNFSCQNVNCRQSDPNSQCVNGACVCISGFSLAAGVCVEGGIIEKAPEYRSFNGTRNNLFQATFGETFTKELRFAPNAYIDGISIPRGADGSLPNVRTISNIVMGQTGLQPGSQLGFTDYVTYWGQILDHDVTWTPAQKENIELFNVEIPLGDPFYDPLGQGTDKSIKMIRSRFVPGTGTSVQNPREHVNVVTAFIDASEVYGENDEKALALRELRGGLLKTSQNGKMPPLSTFGHLQQNPVGKVKDEELFFFGDVRSNDHTGLVALHLLLVLEHNRLAIELAKTNPDWNDETLYQEARRRVIAICQVITVHEYLPAVLGEPLPPYKGYNPNLNPAIFQEFAHGAFRYGHTEVNELLLRLDENFQVTPGGNIPMKDSYMDPSWLYQEGIEPILRGMARQRQREVDVKSVDAIRNFLFGPELDGTGTRGVDLLSISINRARDDGVPDFNTVRQSLGLAPYPSFEAMTDPNTAQLLNTAYNGRVQDCDLLVCGLAESHDTFQDAGSGKFVLANLGETFRVIMKKQFENLRDGDRFWYENNQFSPEEFAAIDRTTMADLILRNTDIKEIQCFVFSLPDGCVLRDDGVQDPNFPVSEKPNEFLVIAAGKSDQHPQAGIGFPFGYVVNGEEAPTLTLVRGETYRFVVDASCSHRMYITTSPIGDGAEPVFDGVIGSESSCLGGVMEFTPNDNHPSEGLFYQCQFHENMGGKILLVSGVAFLAPVLLVTILAVLFAL